MSRLCQLLRSNETKARRGWWWMGVVLVLLILSRAVLAVTPIEQWHDDLDNQLLDYYQDPAGQAADVPSMPKPLKSQWSSAALNILHGKSGVPAAAYPLAAGAMKGRLQQAITCEMALAVRAGRIEDAKAWRAELDLPRGVSANEGSLLLQLVTTGNQDQTAQKLVREAITWQTTRVRELFAEANRDAKETQAPMPDRLQECLGEALTLADLPASIKTEAGLKDIAVQPEGRIAEMLAKIEKSEWAQVGGSLADLQKEVEARLPSLLTDEERQHDEVQLLKLVDLVPKEYASGVRDGKVTVPLEYREALNFTQDARQLVGELAPLWLARQTPGMTDRVERLEKALAHAAEQIDAKVSVEDLKVTLNGAGDILRQEFGVTIRRFGSSKDIVNEVMLETRSLLLQSLTAALNGQWDEAKRLRMEAYTTYDPELEARLMPRDPQLAINIERMLLDGLDHPGVLALLDNHGSSADLQAAYGRVNDALTKAAALLKTDISPTAAITSAASIVAREGLEGLLVIIAILAGLRGDENRGKRRLFWAGVILSVLATGGTWALSQTVIVSLRMYGEVISAVTGVLAIIVLLLITNWLFHQVYWRKWVTTLKAQAQGEKAWQLMSVGFLVGYREGFETVLFLQSLYLDAGGKNVAIGVAIGAVLLLILGVAALKLGMKLPYFQILLATAVMIGFVLIIFVGGTVRAAQTVGWVPVHRLMPGEWPAWLGNWFGFHNTRESIGCQFLTCAVVLGTWRIARWKARRKHERRVSLTQVAAPAMHECSPFKCEDRPGCPFVPVVEDTRTGAGVLRVEAARGAG